MSDSTSTAGLQVAPPKVSAPTMYATLVGVGVACGSLIAGAYVVTAEPIAQGRARVLQEAIAEVLPDAHDSAPYVWSGDEGFVPAGEAKREGAARVHAVYDELGALSGVAVQASAMGYQDVITLLYGYDLAKRAIVGLVVLDSRETPGLGDRIEKDPEFRANFAHLDVTLSDDGQSLRHPIEVVKPGEKSAPYQVDTITGATISSSTVGRMVGASAARWVPRFVHRRHDFTRGGKRP